MNISKDLIVILVIAVLLLGPSRLAGFGSALGKTIRDFRKALEGNEEDHSAASRPPDSPAH